MGTPFNIACRYCKDNIASVRPIRKIAYLNESYVDAFLSGSMEQ